MHRFVACALVATAATGIVAAQEIVLSNSSLELRLDAADGSIRQVHNGVRGLDLVTHAGYAPAFVLTVAGGTASATGFAATPVANYPGAAYDLAWTTDHPGLTVAARVELPSGATDLRFTFHVDNTDPSLVVEGIEYPIVAGIEGLLPSGGQDTALSPAAQGYLFKSPWTNLPPAVVERYYPNGYAGASLQTSAYYREGSGGFAVEARDGSGTAKNLSFYKDPVNGDLRWSVETLQWDRTAGNGLAPGYEVRIAALTKGDWEEAGDRYRAWALGQPWSSRGRVADRPDAEVPRWLYDETLATTFGVSINLDQSRWFQALHDWVGGPLFHVSAFWWPGGTAASEWYGGYNDWSDARVNRANLTAIRAKGDRWAPFLFPAFFSTTATEWAAPAPDPASDPVAPWQPYEMIPDPESPPWAYVCPATPQWQSFHGWRNLTLFDQYGYDANYEDIGAGIGFVRCDTTAHGHPSGSGRWMVDGYRAMLANQRDALFSHAGRPVAAGTEEISELYLADFDFYQARAEASVMSMLEGDEFRAAEKAGWAVKAPLFAYVYHDVGPVRLDGNLKAASQFGGIFWWIAARVVAWGGLPELNYELSALEKFPGMTDAFTWYETYKATFDVIDTTPYASAADRGAYLGRLGRARTGFGRPWLAYGRMTRAARILSGPAPVSVDWHLYNTFDRNTDTSSGIEKGAEFYEQGNFTVDAVVGSAWDDAGRSVGIFLVDTLSTSSNVTVETDPSRHGLAFLNYSRSRIDASGEQSLDVVSGSQSLAVSLPSRAPVVIKLAPAACVAPSCLYRVYRADGAAALASAVAATAPLVTVAGHAWDDAGLADGFDRYYLVDDGGGFPASITVTRTGGSVHLAW